MTTPAPALERMTTVEIRVLFFGKLADRFGRMRELGLPDGVCTVGALKACFAAESEVGAILDDAGIRVAIDQRLVPNDEALVRSGQEVAFLPAFSGG